MCASLLLFMLHIHTRYIKSTYKMHMWMGFRWMKGPRGGLKGEQSQGYLIGDNLPSLNEV